jgi:hypothetical protein
MLTKITSRLTYANAIATLALFLALGGGAYAVATLPKNSVGSKQLKRNAVTSSKVKNRSLLAGDFKAGQLPRGARGPKGAKGDTGAVDNSNFYNKTESDGRFLARETSGIIEISPGPDPMTLLTHGPITFTAKCTDKGAGDFEINISAQSSETGAILGRGADQFALLATPTTIETSQSGAAMIRQFTAAVVSSSTAFNVLVTRGLLTGGHSCLAGVTVLP